MLKPEQLLRIVIELIFVLLGGLVVWLGLSGRIFFNRYGAGWLILSLILMLWGVRAIFKPDRRLSKFEQLTRGVSLILFGGIMFIISHVPFLWVGRLLALCGIVLIARGLVGSILPLRIR